MKRAATIIASAEEIRLRRTSEMNGEIETNRQRMLCGFVLDDIEKVLGIAEGTITRNYCGGARPATPFVPATGIAFWMRVPYLHLGGGREGTTNLEVMMGQEDAFPRLVLPMVVNFVETQRSIGSMRKIIQGYDALTEYLIIQCKATVWREYAPDEDRQCLAIYQLNALPEP